MSLRNRAEEDFANDKGNSKRSPGVRILGVVNNEDA